MNYFLVSQNISDIVNKCEIKPGYRSDNSFIELELIPSHFKIGKGI